MKNETTFEVVNNPITAAVNLLDALKTVLICSQKLYEVVKESGKDA